MNGSAPETPGFESLVAELDEIVHALERRELDLDEALSLFEMGVRRLREAGQLLDAARGRVEELIETAAGDLATLGFEATGGPEAGAGGTKPGPGEGGSPG